MLFFGIFKVWYWWIYGSFS